MHREIPVSELGPAITGARRHGMTASRHRSPWRHVSVIPLLGGIYFCQKVLQYGDCQHARQPRQQKGPIVRRSSILSSVLTVLFGFALISVPFASAQDAAAPASVVSVIGYGEASAPAETATIQISISEGNYSGPPIAQPGATPDARDRESASGVVAALVDAGIAEADIEVFVGPIVGTAGSFYGQARAILQFPLDAPDNARINELVDASALAAADEFLLVGQANARFSVAECDALVSQAREAAIANAQEQADVQAELLGVTIGEVTSSVDLPTTSETDIGYYGPFLQTSSCDADALSEQGRGLFGAPLYDPSLEPTVTAHSRIALSFAIEDTAEATPS